MTDRIARTVQDVLDIQGFVVLGYTDAEEFAKDLASGLISGETINWSGPDDAIVKVIGVATAKDWAAQCRLCAEPVRTALEAPHVGFLKVIAE